MTTEQTDTSTQESEALALPIARVAHEVTCALAVSQGDFTSKPWEKLPEQEQRKLIARTIAFLESPGMPPTADMGPAVAVLSSNERARAYVFHGVVQAIAREQTRS